MNDNVELRDTWKVVAYTRYGDNSVWTHNSLEEAKEQSIRATKVMDGDSKFYTAIRVCQEVAFDPYGDNNEK